LRSDSVGSDSTYPKNTKAASVSKRAEQSGYSFKSKTGCHIALIKTPEQCRKIIQDYAELVRYCHIKVNRLSSL